MGDTYKMKVIVILGLLLAITSVKLTEVEPKTEITSKVEKQETILPGYGYDVKADEKKSEEAVVTKDDKATEEQSKEEDVEAPAATTPAKKDWYTMDCTHENMYHSGIPAEEMCNVASAICHGDFANFYELYWCAYGGSMTGLLLTYLVFIFLIFKWT